MQSILKLHSKIMKVYFHTFSLVSVGIEPALVQMTYFCRYAGANSRDRTGDLFLRFYLSLRRKHYERGLDCILSVRSIYYWRRFPCQSFGRLRHGLDLVSRLLTVIRDSSRRFPTLAGESDLLHHGSALPTELNWLIHFAIW